MQYNFIIILESNILLQNLTLKNAENHYSVFFDKKLFFN